MKIKDILKEENPDFTTKKVSGPDPVTGQMTWDVEYTPLIGVDDNLEDAYQDFKKILKKYPTDERLQKLFDVFSQFKRQYRAHVTRRYDR
jgi:hypothetical protein